MELLEQLGQEVFAVHFVWACGGLQIVLHLGSQGKNNKC